MQCFPSASSFVRACDVKPDRLTPLICLSRSSKNLHDGAQLSPEKPNLRRSATTAGSPHSASSVSRRSSTFLGNFFGQGMIRQHAHAVEKPKT